MVKRVIGGHAVWSPRMQAMARDEKGIRWPKPEPANDFDQHVAW